ncbi:hypothetical protein BH10PSE19_BH10PSE19_00260 [soil metagenome]
MSILTIENINENVVTIRINNTSRSYNIDLTKKIKLSDLYGLEKDEILLIGLMAGKIAEKNKVLLKNFDFKKLSLGDNLKLKEIVFDSTVTFIKEKKHLFEIAYKRLLSNIDVLTSISDDLAFYIGFLYGLFVFTKNEFTLSKIPKPYVLHNLKK